MPTSAMHIKELEVFNKFQSASLNVKRAFQTKNIL